MNHLIAIVGIVVVGLSPISLIVAALLLSERISWLQDIGIFLVIGGVAHVSMKGATKPAKGEQKWISESNPRVSSSGA